MVQVGAYAKVERDKRVPLKPTLRKSPVPPNAHMAVMRAYGLTADRLPEQLALPVGKSDSRSPDQASIEAAPATYPIRLHPTDNEKRTGHPALPPPRVPRAGRTKGAKDRRSLPGQYSGCCVAELYSHHRPHGSLGYQTPAQFAAAGCVPVGLPNSETTSSLRDHSPRTSGQLTQLVPS
jgi:hypothetical protein